MIKVRDFLAAFTWTLLSAIASNAWAQPVSGTGRILKAELPSLKVTAVVHVLNGAPCLFDVSAYGWGVENSCPTEIIRAVIVKQAGLRQIVPLSAFADLAAPRSVKVLGNGSKNFTLVIVGGEASTSYSAHLKFDGSALVSRKVESGEFPKESNEMTTYKFNLQLR